MAGRWAASAAALAFSTALPMKVASVSSGSGRPSVPAATASKRPSSRAAISTTLPGLWVGDHQAGAGLQLQSHDGAV